MKKVALLFPDEYLFSHNYFRPFLTESGDDAWGETKFIVNPQAGDFDAIVATQSIKPLTRTYSLFCPPTKTLLVLKEPPDILFLPEDYTRQFYCSLGQDKRVHSKMQIFSQSGHHWFTEVNVRKSENIVKYPKIKLISAIVSNKTDTPGHRKRLHFIQELKKHFGDQLDWFGRGIKELETNKIDGLLNYKYHIVLENGCWDDYWTEKLADAFVANCFPFYWGAPNIHKYFEPNELKLVDIENVDRSIQVIEESIAQDLYQYSQEQIADAREKIFTKYHPYQTYLDVLNHLPNSNPSKVVIKPHCQFNYDFTTRWQMRLQHYSSALFKNPSL